MPQLLQKSSTLISLSIRSLKIIDHSLIRICLVASLVSVIMCLLIYFVVSSVKSVYAHFSHLSKRLHIIISIFIDGYEIPIMYRLLPIKWINQKTLHRYGYGYPNDEYFFLKIFDVIRLCHESQITQNL